MPIVPDSHAVDGVRTMTANIVLEMGYAADLHRERPRRHRRGAVRVHPADHDAAQRYSGREVRRDERWLQPALASPAALGGRLLADLRSPGCRSNLMPACFAKEDALVARIARSSRRRRAVSVLLRWLAYLAAAVTAAVLLFVVGYILVRRRARAYPRPVPVGVHLRRTSRFMPALASTLIMAAARFGAWRCPWVSASAIYLVEYAPPRQPSSCAWCASPPRRCRAFPPSSTACSACCSS